MMASWLARVPVRIYHIHGLPLMTAQGIKRTILTQSERVSCLCAHRVLCVSPSVRQVAIDLDLCPAAVGIQAVQEAAPQKDRLVADKERVGLLGHLLVGSVVDALQHGAAPAGRRSC